MINAQHSQIHDLTADLERMAEMTEDELEGMKGGFKSHLPTPEQKNLREYQAEQRKEQQEKRKQTQTRGARMQEFAYRLIGRTPEREFGRHLTEAQSLHTRYKSRCEALDTRLKDQLQELSEVGDEQVQAQGLFEVCKHHYGIKAERTDRLAAEVEMLESDSQDRISPELYTKREQLNHAREEQRRVAGETDEAMQLFLSADDRFVALSEQTDALRDQLSTLRSQETSLGIAINKWELLQSIYVGNKQPSARALYEEIGIVMQEMDARGHSITGAPESIDTTYAPTVRSRNHRSVEEWMSERP